MSDRDYYYPETRLERLFNTLAIALTAALVFGFTLFVIGIVVIGILFFR